MLPERGGQPSLYSSAIEMRLISRGDSLELVPFCRAWLEPQSWLRVYVRALDRDPENVCGLFQAIGISSVAFSRLGAEAKFMRGE